MHSNIITLALCVLAVPASVTARPTVHALSQRSIEPVARVAHPISLRRRTQRAQLQQVSCESATAAAEAGKEAAVVGKEKGAAAAEKNKEAAANEKEAAAGEKEAAAGEKNKEAFAFGEELAGFCAKGLLPFDVPIGAAERWSKDMVELAPTTLYMPLFLPGTADMALISAMF